MNYEYNHHQLYLYDYQYISYYFFDDKFDSDLLDDLSTSNKILISIPPRDGKDLVLKSFFKNFKKNNFDWITYLSATSVYGDHDGDWVNEKSKTQPTSKNGKERLIAEKNWISLFHDEKIPIQIFRLSGIYGPDRLPVKRLRSGAPVVAADEAPWSNRVHVDDLCRVCLAAARVESPHSVYNVSDGHPTTMTDFFFQAAASLGLPCPPVVSMARAKATLGEGMLSYLAESKRIDNTRMRNHLRIEPEFPDLARGFADAVRRSTQA